MSWIVGRGLVVIVAILVSTALALVRPAGAGAATVAVEAASAGPVTTKVRYRAAPGEKNDVIVERSASAMYAVTISDSGAVLSAGASCVAVDAHTARCDTSSPPTVYAEFDDSNDRLRPSRDSGVVMANGGRGDDVLELSPLFGGFLDGGGGRDELHSTGGNDVLTDGDRDGAAGDAGPGPDVLDGGGGGDDAVSYQQRRQPISVDLASARPAGAPGEGDTIRAVEQIIGGSGPDHLAGTDGPNVIVGSGGADTLIGRGGRDDFGSLSGITLFGLVPDLSLVAAAQGTRGDTVLCGRGLDRLWHPSSTTFIDPSCEWVFVSRTLPATFPKGQREGDWAMRAYPRRHGSSMTYSVDCSGPDSDESARWAAVRCAGTVTLRDTSRRRRLLATGTLPRGHLTLVARLRFTPIGRRLASRRQGVQASLRVRGKNLPTARWTIRLKLPR
jgi:RTX calcium-binding nonapeptide repeat (4 copies)